MKKLTTVLLFLIAATFMSAPPVYAKAKYNSTLSNISTNKICGSSECKGDIVGGQLILIGKDGRKHVAPDGTYTDESGKNIQVIDGKVLQKSDQPMKRDR